MRLFVDSIYIRDIHVLAVWAKILFIIVYDQQRINVLEEE